MKKAFIKLIRNESAGTYRLTVCNEKGQLLREVNGYLFIDSEKIKARAFEEALVCQNEGYQINVSCHSF